MAEIPVGLLSQQARTTKVTPGRMIVTAIAWIFVALGFAVGGTWRGIVFCAVSARYGYWRGLGLTDADIALRITPPEPAPGRA